LYESVFSLVKQVINYKSHNKIQRKTIYLKKSKGEVQTRWERENGAPGAVETVYKSCEKVYKVGKRQCTQW
jgi:hypothetical protein